MIDEKALEAAAQAIFQADEVTSPVRMNAPWELLRGYHRDRCEQWARAAIEAYEAAKPAAEASQGGEPCDLVSRSEVLRVLRSLGDQDADLALYGAADNARAREYGEAAATRACCAIALMPASPPAPATVEMRNALERLERVFTYPVATEINARGYDIRGTDNDSVEYAAEIIRAALAAPATDAEGR